MLDVVREAVLVAAVLTTGMFAGLFFTFSMSVMPGLARSSDRTFVAAMQHINTAIINPWFAAAFMGSPLSLLAAVLLHTPADLRAPLPWLVASLILVAAVIAVTMIGNVPMNTALDRAGDPNSDAAAARARSRFEPGWVRWNTVRAAASTLALACLALALLQ